MNKLTLIPYCKINNEWTLPDDVLDYAWAKMEKQRLIKKVFYDGKVSNAEDFKIVCKQEGVHTLFSCSDDGDIAAIGFLTQFELNHAHAHWICYRESWGEIAEQAAKDSLNHWFNYAVDGKYLFDVLIGVTPEDNETAVSFAERIGFTILGIIPGILYNKYKDSMVGAVFSYIERRSTWDQ